MTATTQLCNKCQAEKPAAEFCKDRKTRSGLFASCRVCLAARAAMLRVTKGDYLRNRSKEWYWKNRDRSLASAQKWRAENPGKVSELWERWYSNNREPVLQRKRLHTKANPEKNNAYAGLRRAREKSAMPPWASKDAIDKIYAEAAKRTKETGEKWVVDHEIPLKNNLVSGLHVETNLRIITFTENAKKYNRWSPEEYGK